MLQGLGFCSSFRSERIRVNPEAWLKIFVIVRVTLCISRSLLDQLVFNKLFKRGNVRVW